MNLLQRITLALGLLAAITVAAVPPWEYVSRYPKAEGVTRFAGWFPVWQPPVPWDADDLGQRFGIYNDKFPRFISARVVTQQLVIYELVILIASAGLFFIVSKPPP